MNREEDGRRLSDGAAFFSATAPVAADARRRLLLGTRNYVLQTLVKLYGRVGAASFCRAYLEPRRWTELSPVCFMGD